MALPWSPVCKVIKVGDFVEVTSGPLIGLSGWVDCVDEEVVNLVEKVASTTSPDMVKVYSGQSDLFISANPVDRGSKFTLIGSKSPVCPSCPHLQHHTQMWNHSGQIKFHGLGRLSLLQNSDIL